jgi:GMP synthase-like glutamine amidotransferase
LSTAGQLRALVLQHEEAAPPGLVDDWLRERRIAARLQRMDHAPAADLRGADLVVALGSECAAYDDEVPFVPSELELLGEAHSSGIPVLGICFGGQLLARALGGRCYRAEQPEIGWRPVRPLGRGIVAAGPWMEWHFDTFELPAGAELLAESDSAPQAYLLEKSMGLQFHPEVTLPIVEGWVRSAKEELADRGIEAGEILADSERLAAEAARRARALFDGFLAIATGERES